MLYFLQAIHDTATETMCLTAPIYCRIKYGLSPKGKNTESL